MTPLTIIGPHHTNIEYDFNEVQSTCIGIIQALDANDIPVNLGAAGAALVMGRLLCPGRLEQDAAVKFLGDVFEWAGAYFAEGEAN